MNGYVAIEGFKDLTEQEVFDMAARHILSTGKKSLGFNRCVYSGTGCAAAPFIKEYFRRSMDQYGAWENLVAKGEVPGEHMHLIGQLQYAHDYSDRKDFLPQFKQHMRVVAGMFNLSDKVLED